VEGGLINYVAARVCFFGRKMDREKRCRKLGGEEGEPGGEEESGLVREGAGCGLVVGRDDKAGR
jgi:hypothetical protein